jgi:hypothetical protein
MNQRFPAHAKALRATLLCAALVPLVAACGAKSSASDSTAVGAAAGTTHASASAAATAQAANSTAASPAAGASATCPSAAAISAAAGGSYPAPKVQNASGDTLCDYSDASTGANLNIVIAPAAGITDAALQEAIASQAQAVGGKAKQLSGLGTTAYIFTGNDASTNSDGIATTMIGALSSQFYVIVGGELSPTADEAVARLILSE